MSMFGIRFAIIFQEDGLNLEAVKDDLKRYGEITEIDDDILTLSDGEHPVKVIYMDSDFGKFLRLKLDYNCKCAEDSNYVLFPCAE